MRMSNAILRQYHEAKVVLSEISLFFYNVLVLIYMFYSIFYLVKYFTNIEILRMLYLLCFWWSKLSFLIHPLIPSFSWRFACSWALSFEFHVS